MKIKSRRWRLTAAAVAAIAASAAAGVAFAGTGAAPARAIGLRPATGLGPTTGLLPRGHLTLENAIQVDLSKETVRLPLYKGIAYKGTPRPIARCGCLLYTSDAADE